MHLCILPYPRPRRPYSRFSRSNCGFRFCKTTKDNQCYFANPSKLLHFWILHSGKPNFVSPSNSGFGSVSGNPSALNSNEVVGNNYFANGVTGPVADFTSNGEDGNQGGYNYPKSLPPVISKSVYVHIAPPEEEIPKQKVIVPKVPPKKNYQIVFIRAPTPPPPTIPVIPPFPPQSDKTLIYVLHPKLEEAPPIRIPPPPENSPVKPEVYFIR